MYIKIQVTLTKMAAMHIYGKNPTTFLLSRVTVNVDSQVSVVALWATCF